MDKNSENCHKFSTSTPKKPKQTQEKPKFQHHDFVNDLENQTNASVPSSEQLRDNASILQDSSFGIPIIKPILKINPDIGISKNCVNEVHKFISSYLEENGRRQNDSCKSNRTILSEDNFQKLVEHLQKIITNDQKETLSKNKRIEELRCLGVIQQEKIQILMNYLQQLVINGTQSFRNVSDCVNDKTTQTQPIQKPTNTINDCNPTQNLSPKFWGASNMTYNKLETTTVTQNFEKCAVYNDKKIQTYPLQAFNVDSWRFKAGAKKKYYPKYGKYFNATDKQSDTYNFRNHSNTTQTYASQSPTINYPDSRAHVNTKYYPVQSASPKYEDNIADYSNTIINTTYGFKNVSDYADRTQTYSSQTSSSNSLDPKTGAIKKNYSTKNIAMLPKFEKSVDARDIQKTTSDMQSFRSNSVYTDTTTQTNLSQKSFLDKNVFLKSRKNSTDTTDAKDILDNKTVVIIKAANEGADVKTDGTQIVSSISKNASNTTGKQDVYKIGTWANEIPDLETDETKIVLSKSKNATNKTDKQDIIKIGTWANEDPNLETDETQIGLSKSENIANTTNKQKNLENGTVVHLAKTNKTLDLKTGAIKKSYLTKNISSKSEKAVNTRDMPKTINRIERMTHSSQVFTTDVSCPETAGNKNSSIPSKTEEASNATGNLKPINDIQTFKGVPDYKEFSPNEKFFKKDFIPEITEIKISSILLKAEGAVNATDKLKPINGTQNFQDPSHCMQTHPSQVFTTYVSCPETAEIKNSSASPITDEASNTTDKFKPINDAQNFKGLSGCKESSSTQESCKNDSVSKTETIKEFSSARIDFTKSEKTADSKNKKANSKNVTVIYISPANDGSGTDSTQLFSWKHGSGTNKLDKQDILENATTSDNAQNSISNLEKIVSTKSRRAADTTDQQESFENATTVQMTPFDKVLSSKPNLDKSVSTKSRRAVDTTDKSKIIQKKEKNNLATANKGSSLNADATKKKVKPSQTEIKPNNKSKEQKNTNKHEDQPMVHLSNGLNSLERYLLSRIEAINMIALHPGFLAYLLKNSLMISSSSPGRDLTEKDVIATDSQIAEFMKGIDEMFEVLNKFIINIHWKIAPRLLQMMANSEPDKEYKLKNVQLIPLKEGLRRIFPGILGFTEVKYIRYSSLIIIQRIKYINFIMQKFMYGSQLNIVNSVNNFQKIFVKVIQKNKIITDDMLIEIYNQIADYLVPEIIKNFLDTDFINLPKMKESTVQNILTKDELKSINNDVRNFLNEGGPVVIADFIENPFIQSLIKRNEKITFNRMYDYFINRDVIKVFRKHFIE